MNIAHVKVGDVVQIDGLAYGKVMERVDPPGRGNPRLRVIGLTGRSSYPLLTGNRITGIWHRSKHTPLPH